MTIKATSALAILAIWVTMIPAVIANPGSWWALIFAFFATGAIGFGAMRRLGLSRVIAITGIWLGTAIAIHSSGGDHTGVSIFAFLSTCVVAYSIMRRDAYLGGLAVFVAWVMTGMVVGEQGGGWISVFAFLTAGAIASSRSKARRGLIASLAWGAAGLIMLAADGMHWLAIVAFILSATSLGFENFVFPRRFEWDLFDRDDDGERIKVVHH